MLVLLLLLRCKSICQYIMLVLLLMAVVVVLIMMALAFKSLTHDQNVSLIVDQHLEDKDHYHITITITSTTIDSLVGLVVTSRLQDFIFVLRGKKIFLRSRK